METIAQGMCRWCHSYCRINVHSKDGVLVKTEHDRTDPRGDTIWLPSAPCRVTCPASQDVQGYIAQIRKGDFKEALKVIKYDVPMPGVIGRICPHPCESECDRALHDKPVSICALKRYVADKYQEDPPRIEATRGKVAIIGGGPAGIACANYLIEQGYQPTIFEASATLGGMLNSIPEYRLPRDVLQREIKSIIGQGVEVKTNTRVGTDITLNRLLQEYKAVFVSVGAQKSEPLQITGAELPGVLPALAVLQDRAAGKLPADAFSGKNVGVIGGGNVAVDAARSAVRLGARSVTIFYRRTRAEMPASKEEIEAAEKEGITLSYLVSPSKITANGSSLTIELTRMKLGPSDASGRAQPIAEKGSEFSTNLDILLVAIGQTSDLSFLGNSGIETMNGRIKVNPATLQTSKAGVFAGGDVRTGASIAIEALSAGKRAGISIERYLEGKHLSAGRTDDRGKPAHPAHIDQPKPIERQTMQVLATEQRTGSFSEVELGLTDEQAMAEANRCLNCGCARQNMAKEYIYHPDRVRFPLKRVGERGENRWERISWNQALDEIAAKLTELKGKYGPETLFLTQGTNRSHGWAGQRFMNLFGTPNIVGPATICYAPAIAVSAAMIGWPLRYRGDAVIEFDENGKSLSKAIMLMGIVPSEAYPRFWRTMKQALDQGTKLIVLDPRMTKEAAIADIWLQPRPGTDTALLMSMINVIIQRGLYDRQFVDRWCYGFEQLKERAKEYTPEKAAEICWVPAEKIVAAAVMYATCGPVVSYHGMGAEQQESSLELIQAKTILSAICGYVDVPGGDHVPGPMYGDPKGPWAPGMELSGKLPEVQKLKQLGSDKHKLLTHQGRDWVWNFTRDYWDGKPPLRAYAIYPHVIEAILTGKPYPVRACISAFSNPMVHMSNSKRVYKALKSLDLYVVKDFWMTPSAQLADYVLPSACWAERPNMEPQGIGGDLVAGEGCLDPITGEHEYYNEYDFFRGLALRMGQEKYWPGDTLEEFYDDRLKRLETNLHTFMVTNNGVFENPMKYRKYESQKGFATESGKLELYSKVFEHFGYDPLPAYVEPKESPLSTPGLAEKFPLMLITGGRKYPYFHSEHRQIPSIRERNPDPILQINPNTAKSLGIADGDWVWIESPRGAIKMKAKCFEGIHPRVVHGEHSWWFPEQPGQEPWLRGAWQSNVNVLTDDSLERLNPIGGGWPLKQVLCRVTKVDSFYNPDPQ